MKRTLRDTICERIVHWGLVFLLAGLPLWCNPFALSYFTTPKAQALCALVVVVGAGALVRLALGGPGWRRPRAALLAAVAACLVSAVVSTWWSDDVALSLGGDPARHEGLRTVVCYALLPLLFGCLPASRQQLQQLLGWLTGAMLLVALYGIAQYLGWNPTEHFIVQWRSSRIGSTIGNANFLGRFLVLTLPLAAVQAGAAARTQRVLGAVALVAGSICLALTFTRASWIAALSGMVVMGMVMGRCWLRHYGLRLCAGLAVALVCAALMSAVVLWQGGRQAEVVRRDIAQRLLASGDFAEGAGVATRLFVWQRAAAVIARRPLIGHGLDTGVVVLHPYNREYNRRFDDWVIIDRAHNNYLDLLMSQGLFGLTAYLSLAALALACCLRVAQRAARGPGRLLAAGVAASLAGCLVNDVCIFSAVAVSPLLWALFGLSFCLEALYAR